MAVPPSDYVSGCAVCASLLARVADCRANYYEVLKDVARYAEEASEQEYSKLQEAAIDAYEGLRAAVQNCEAHRESGHPEINLRRSVSGVAATA